MKATRYIGRSDEFITRPMDDKGEPIPHTDYLWGCDCGAAVFHWSNQHAPICGICASAECFSSLVPMENDREALGVFVREVWADFCKRTFPNPPAGWTKPWEELSPEMREVDRVIGEAVVTNMFVAISKTLGPLIKTAVVYAMIEQEGFPADQFELDFGAQVREMLLREAAAIPLDLPTARQWVEDVIREG